MQGYILLFKIQKWLKLLQNTLPCVNLKYCLCKLSIRSADKVGRPFCFCSVSYYFFIIKVCLTQSADLSVFVLFFLFFLLLRFPTLVGNLSVFVLSFLLLIFILYFQLHCPVIPPSILYRFTSNFQNIIIMTRQCTVWILKRIPLGMGTGRGPKN